MMPRTRVCTEYWNNHSLRYNSPFSPMVTSYLNAKPLQNQVVGRHARQTDVRLVKTLFPAFLIFSHSRGIKLV